jgi:hypothetical protein
MPTGEFSVETKASAADTHAYLADFRNEADWRDDVISCEIESGEPGQDGTIYRQHVNQGPGTAWHRIQVCLGPGFEVSFEMLGDFVIQASGVGRVTELPAGGSFVRYRLKVTLRGPAAVIRPIVARELSRRMTAYAGALKPRLDALCGG